MKKNIVIAKLLILIVISLLPAITFAAQVGKVEIVVNTAQELESQKFDWNKLLLSNAVMGDSVVRTLENSKLKLALIDGSFILLTENSKTKLENIEPQGKSFMKMFSGKLRAVVKKVVSPSSSFSVSTPTAIVGVKGTDFAIILSKDVAEVIAFRGLVTVSNVLPSIPGTVELEANYYTRVTRFAPPTPPVLLSPEEIEAIIANNNLSEEAMNDEGINGDMNIEGTIDNPIENPGDVIGGTGDLGNTDIENQIVIEPRIEVPTIGIQEPPLPPPY